MTFDRQFQIGKYTVGDSCPAFVIAEIGVNHNGDPNLAKELIDLAADAGADAVKFQTFKAQTLVTARADAAKYQEVNCGMFQSQLSMLSKLELEYGAFEQLKKYCEEANITFLSTPFSVDDAKYLREIGVQAYKIGSGDLTNIPLIEEISAWQKPIILSTGMATIDEVQRSVSVVQESRNTKLALLQCTSSYPCPATDVNLRAMLTLAEEFRTLVGFSDHTVGTLASSVAVGMGASIIEKHLTKDRSLPGPDHQASIEPQEFKQLVSQVRLTEQFLGQPEKIPTGDEAGVAQVARKSICASTAIPKGTVLTKEVLCIKRPSGGLSPHLLPEILGRVLNRDMSTDDMICEEHLED